MPRRRSKPQQRTLWIAGGASLLLLLLYLAFSLLLSWVEAPPSDLDDLCAVYSARPGWYRASRQASLTWGVGEPVQLAFLYQESAFQARARPPRSWLLRIIPWRRPSSAYGYAQVLDGTWREYRQVVDRPGASRHRFGDVVDFIGWYGTEIQRLTGIDKADPYHLYLAYHEGPAGYRRGSHRSKEWLLTTARRVADRAARYDTQLADCREQLDRAIWWRRFWVFLATAGPAVAIVYLLYRRERGLGGRGKRKRRRL